MTTIRKTNSSPPSSTQRTSSTSEAKKSTSASHSARGQNDVSSFTPASNTRSPVVLQPASNALSGTANAAALQESGSGGSQPEQVRVNASGGLNLRSVPSTQGNEPQAIIPDGATLQVTPDANGDTRQDGFVHVSWNDNGTLRSGWVSEQFTSPVASAPTGPATPAHPQGLTVPVLDLQLGDSGTGVRNLQQGLVSLGYMTPEQVSAANGSFDATTQDALKRFQADHDVSPAAGYFGPLTREAFRTALGLPRPLGTLSQAYESNGDPGAVSSGVGDYGGVSYGAYQFASNTGSPVSFVNSLRDTHPDYYNALSGKTPGTEEFSNAWRELAARDPEGFLQAQHDYVQQHYYEAARSDLHAELGLDLSTHSQALNDVLWSTAVQHGTGGALDIFQTALEGKDVSQMTDAEIIQAIYAERGRTDANGTLVHFSGSSRAVQQSVANRFINEERDALDALASESP